MNKRDDEKLYKEARMVAAKTHGNQLYDKIFPYSKHLDDVVEVLKDFGLAGKYLVAGYLHDSMEDGNLSYKDIKGYFGEEVAEIVYCVTDELGRNRKERKEKTLPKIRSNPDAVIVKLADRIANIQHGGKIEMYKKEYGSFRDSLIDVEVPYGADKMWQRLDNLLDWGGDE